MDLRFIYVARTCANDSLGNLSDRLGCPGTNSFFERTHVTTPRRDTRSSPCVQERMDSDRTCGRWGRKKAEGEGGHRSQTNVKEREAEESLFRRKEGGSGLPRGAHN